MLHQKKDSDPPTEFALISLLTPMTVDELVAVDFFWYFIITEVNETFLYVYP